MHFDPCPKRSKPIRKFWMDLKQFGLVQNRFGPIEGQGIGILIKYSHDLIHFPTQKPNLLCQVFKVLGIYNFA